MIESQDYRILSQHQFDRLAFWIDKNWDTILEHNPHEIAEIAELHFGLLRIDPRDIVAAGKQVGKF